MQIQTPANCASEKDLYRPTILNNLGLALQRQFEITQSMDELNAAIEAASSASNCIPENSPGRPGILNNLGTALEIRFEELYTI